MGQHYVCIDYALTPFITLPHLATFYRNINSRSVFLGCKYAIAQFLSQDPHPSGHKGWIINTASIMGLRGLKGGAGAYCASKGAVVQLTRHIAAEYGAEKIHCNALCPGCKFIITFSFISFLCLMYIPVFDASFFSTYRSQQTHSPSHVFQSI